MKLLFVLSVHGARQCDTLTKRSGIRTNSTVSKQKTLILLSTVRLMEFFSLSSKLITAVMVKSHHTRYGLVSITNSTFFVCYSSHLAFEYYFAVAWCFFFILQRRRCPTVQCLRLLVCTKATLDQTFLSGYFLIVAFILEF